MDYIVIPLADTVNAGLLSPAEKAAIAAAAVAPVHHAASHAQGGADAITISASQVSGLAASATTDTTNADNIAGGTLATARVGDLSGTYVVNTKLGMANGVATLDPGSKLSIAQIPAALVGAVVYQGTWNATTNTPALASGVGTKGYYYKVSVAGTLAIDGISQWNVGDTIIFDGSTWDKIDGISNEVVSVAGLNGVISASGLKSALAISSGDVSGLGALATETPGNNVATVLGATAGATGSFALQNDSRIP